MCKLYAYMIPTTLASMAADLNLEIEGKRLEFADDDAEWDNFEYILIYNALVDNDDEETPTVLRHVGMIFERMP